MDKHAIKALLVMGLFIALYINFVMPHFVTPPPPVEEQENGEPDPTVRNGDPAAVPVDPPPVTVPEITRPGDRLPGVPPDNGDPIRIVALDQEGRSVVQIVHDTMPDDPRRGAILVFNPVGGSLEQVILKEFAPLPIDLHRIDTSINPEQRLELIRPGPGRLQPGHLVDPRYHLPLHSAVYDSRYDADTGRVVFTASFSNGLKIEKTYTPADSHRVRLTVRVENTGAEPARATYDVVAVAGLTSEEFRNEDRLTIARNPRSKSTRTFDKLLGSDLEQPAGSSSSITPSSGQGVTWAGAANRYFAMVLAAGDDPARPTASEARAVRMEGDPAGRDERQYTKKHPGSVAVLLRPGMPPVEITDEGRLRAGAAYEQNYFFFAGPKSPEALEAPALTGWGIGEILDYGWTHYLVQVVVWVLAQFQRLVRNWGLAIILLTVLIRLAMHRLTKKSQISMMKMQEMQPKIKAIQEKYKNDRQKLAEEQMKIYKENGNPFLGGCMPMLLQLPIFMALYRGLHMNIALRQASLLPQSWGWLTDLSQPDRLYELAKPLDLLFGLTLYEINLLPLLMIGLMFLQQKLQPTNPDPQARQQQKMMMVMMSLFFGLLFYTMPSGLTLYFIVSTGWGLVESRIIRRHIEHLKAAKAAPAHGKKA